MSFLQTVLAAVFVMGICVLVMAVGVILRNKTFTSCGCASLEYKGEKIRCAGCPDKEDKEEAELIAREHEPVKTSHS